MTSEHDYIRTDVSIQEQGVFAKPVVICGDVWIGANVTILAGVNIGEGAVIAAGAVVNKDVPPYTVAAGVPARPVKLRILD